MLTLHRVYGITHGREVGLAEARNINTICHPVTCIYEVKEM